MAGALPSAAQDIFVSPSGSDSNSCTTAGSPCQTIQGGVDKASAGQTISVAAGSYTGAVVIDKALTLNGARAGVSTGVRTAGAASESVVDASGQAFGFDVQADNVAINGFDIKGDVSTWAGVRMLSLIHI